MNVLTMSALVVVGLAGSALAAVEPVVLDASVGNVRHAGHIYFNVATGERITTLIEAGDAQRPVDGEEGTEIWIVGGGAVCADFGSSTSYFYALDSTTANYGAEISPMLIDWGDIETDTVVDCVQIHWISDHADTDTDSDSIADGVAGFAGDWVYYDGMNGRSPQMESIALPIIGLSFFSLPGEYPVDPETVVLWTADIDLGSSFGTSLIFEIGDTDSLLQEANVHNARMDLNDNDLDSIPDIDPDQDGLADWGWSINYTQPGTKDVDNADSDSDTQTGIDGDPEAFAIAGLTFGMPWPGHAEFDSSTGTWEWILDGPTAGLNEDAFALVDDFGSGVFWFGGFSCQPYVPGSNFSIVLYGPDDGTICPADLSGPGGSPDGVLDFFDISHYLGLFGFGDLGADVASPSGCGSPDGVLDFFDISCFLSRFADGCP